MTPLLPGAEFLSPCMTIDSDHPMVVSKAAALKSIEAITTFVREEISHPADTDGRNISIRASEVLNSGEGICYSQAHLLVALLRSAGFPAGLRYQLVEDAVLHGVVAVWAPSLSATGGWLMLDPRFASLDPRNSGDKWLTRSLQPPFESNLPGVFAEPAASVLAALKEATDAQQLLRTGLPRTLSVSS